MIIRFTKKDTRNLMTCMREDGSHCSSNLGPNLPFHDIAHVVTERTLGLKKGFYGNIAQGFSVEQLSDTALIKTLGAESWMAEIVTRALQSLSSGACTHEQFIPMVQAELDHLSIGLKHGLDEDLIAKMEAEYRMLVSEWNALPNGGKMELSF